MAARFSMLYTSSAIKADAPNRRAIAVLSFNQGQWRGQATTALPRPIPRINEMRTTAKDCSEAPKIKQRHLDASTSNPIETAPVKATRTQPQRKMTGVGRGETEGGAGDSPL